VGDGVVAAVTIASCGVDGEQAKAPRGAAADAGAVADAGAESASSGGEAVGATDALKRLRGRTRVCYYRVLQKDPDDPGGSVQLRVTIGPTGEVTNIVATGTANKTIQNCVADVVRGATFKPPEAGEATFGTAYMCTPAH
jgi:outer membrane biosynthesis protein TonB